MSFRLVAYEDVDLLFKWVNDPEVRRSAFSYDDISYSDHQEWFRKKFESEDCMILIFSLGSQPVGQVRIDIGQDDTAEVDISIDRNFRGRKFSSDVLRIASEFAIAELGIKALFAHIKLDNEKSLRSFERAGYQDKKIIVFKNQECFKLKFIE